MSTHTWPQIIEHLLSGADLSPEAARWSLEEVMTGQASNAQIAGFLVSLRAKGVTGPELAAMVEVMVAHAVPVIAEGVLVDTCGTGGDNAGTANISTMAAVVVAAAGEKVVKHGNRAASSQSGSADVLEALGVRIEQTPEDVRGSLDRASIAFCFARTYHPAMRFAGPVRAELGIRTVFNYLGPLSNPARPQAQVVGVADEAMAPIVAAALAERGTAALVVRGDDGLDEITTTTTTTVWDVRTREVTRTVIDGADMGIPRADAVALAGGDAQRNADIARIALRPESAHELSPVRDAVVLNAAAALVAANAARGEVGDLVEDLAAQVVRARAAITSGRAQEVLAAWSQA